jgi:hypothetical protein
VAQDGSIGRQVEPEGLSARTSALWRSERVRTRSVARKTLLLEACRALDRADELAALVATQGPTIESKRSGVVRLNPLLMLEAREREAFRKLASLLELNWCPGIDGAPMGTNGR